MVKRYGFDEFGGNFKPRNDGFMVDYEDYQKLECDNKITKIKLETAEECLYDLEEDYKKLEEENRRLQSENDKLEEIKHQLHDAVLQEHSDWCKTQDELDRLKAEYKPNKSK